MKIQWFPGHMTKAIRLIEDNLKNVDAVIYVLDARAPYSCINPLFEKLTEGKSRIYALNKSDLVKREELAKWAKRFEAEGNGVAVVNGTDINSAKALIRPIRELSNKRVEKFAAKGVYRPIRVMVIGVPNSGKSTIINGMAGRKSAQTGDKPGVTKGKQWIRIDGGIELLDTPGTLWGRFEDEIAARHLLFIGSIKDDITDITEAAPLLLDELMEIDGKAVLERYKLSDPTLRGRELFEAVMKQRGFILKGGEFDYERAAKAVLDDFRKGKTGKFILDIF